MRKQVKQLQELVKQHKDDFALPELEAILLVSCAKHLESLRGEAQKQYARQCADYYRQQRADDFFITPHGREIFDNIADAYQQIIDFL